MNIKQVIDFYINKNGVYCPLTEQLVKSGYQQTCTGYISYALKNKIEVDYNKGLPSQYWHLIESYCNNKKDTDLFTKRVQCGELLFWMAEVIGDREFNKKLVILLNKIVKSGQIIECRNSKKPNVKYDRRKWNKEIRSICFDFIEKNVNI